MLEDMQKPPGNNPVVFLFSLLIMVGQIRQYLNKDPYVIIQLEACIKKFRKL